MIFHAHDGQFKHIPNSLAASTVDVIFTIENSKANPTIFYLHHEPHTSVDLLSLLTTYLRLLQAIILSLASCWPTYPVDRLSFLTTYLPLLLTDSCEECKGVPLVVNI